MIIEGTVAPGYESVRQLYEQQMSTLKERNTQLCVYVGETCVVDLWGSAIDDTDFNADSLVNVFSSGKSLESIALAALYEQDLLDFDAPIAQYWPEFAQHGKDSITVADLMRHEAGLSAFTETLSPQSLHPANLRDNSVSTIIERQTPLFPQSGGSPREYHAITRGWVANELFRRVEPQGRTMGEFYRQEISTPLDADIFIGLQEDELSRLDAVHMLSPGFQLIESLKPKRFGRKMELNFAQLAGKAWRLFSARKQASRTGTPVPITGMQRLSAINQPDFAKAEIPSAGARCSARGLAKLAATLANGGRFGDQHILSAKGSASLYENPIQRPMMLMDTTFTQAGLAKFGRATGGPEDLLNQGLHDGREGFYGWLGLGGSIFQWHPEHKIGFAYVPTSLNWLDIVNERGKRYQAEMLNCVSGD